MPLKKTKAELQAELETQQMEAELEELEEEMDESINPINQENEKGANNDNEVDKTSSFNSPKEQAHMEDLLNSVLSENKILFPKENEDISEQRKIESEVKQEERQEVKREDPNSEVVQVRKAHSAVQRKMQTFQFTSTNSINGIKESFDKRLANVPPEQQKEKFMEMYKKNSEKFYQETIESLGSFKKKNGTNVNIPEDTKAFEDYRKRLFDYCKNGNENLKDLEYPAFGGVPVSDIQKMQKEEFDELPKELQNDKERKQIENFEKDNQPKKEEVKKEEIKKEEVNKEVIPENPEAADVQVRKAYNAVGKKTNTADKTTTERINSLKDSFDKRLSKFPPEQQKEKFMEMFKKDSENFYQDSVDELGRQKQKAYTNVNIPEDTKSYENYRKQLFDYIKNGNENLKGLEYPAFGGVPAEDIQKMQEEAFNSLPKELQNEEEKKQIENFNKEVKEEVKKEEVKKEEEVKQEDSKNKEVAKEQVQEVKKEEVKKEEIKQEQVEQPKKEFKPITTPMTREEYVQKVNERNKEVTDYFNKNHNTNFTFDEKGDFSNRLESIKDSKQFNKLTAYEQEYKKEYQNVLDKTLASEAKLKADGQSNKSFAEITQDVDAYMRLQHEHALANNPDLGVFLPPNNGGMTPDQIREAQIKAFYKMPQKAQDSKEKKAIYDQYDKNKEAYKQQSKDNLNKTISDLNNGEGTKMNSEKIQKYLDNAWNKCKGNTTEEKQAAFQETLRNFNKASFETINNHAVETENFSVQRNNFDVYTRSVENYCKANGYINPDKPHELCGGLNPNTMKEIQESAFKKMPQNINSWAADSVNKLTDQTYEKSKAAEGKSFSEGKIDWAYSNVKAFIQDRKSDSKTTKERIDNLDKFSKKLLDNVPKNGESKKNDLEVKEALAVARQMEAKNAERSNGWKIANRKEYAAQQKFVQDIVAGIEAKGYSKEQIDNYLHNPIPPEQDPIAQYRNLQKNNLNQTFKDNQELINDFDKVQQRQQLEESDRERFSVPEADNTKEIVNPEQRSQFLNLEVDKQKQLEVNDPNQQNNEQQPQQQQQPKKQQGQTL